MSARKSQNWGWYPTQEELLDINFWSIVSDCRAIKAGTLIPRSWTDISSTWLDDEEPRNKQMHRPAKTRAKLSQATKRVWVARGPSRRIKALHTKMVAVLQSGGMDFKSAHDKARELLHIEKNLTDAVRNFTERENN